VPPPALLELGLRLATGLLIAAALALVAMGLSRVRFAPLLMGLVLCLPGLAVNILNPGYRTVGYHAWMHSAFTYQCMDRLGTPGGLEDVLAAGMNVRYAWGHHWLVGLVAGGLGLAPTIAVLLLDAAMLVGSVLLLAHASVLLGVPRRWAHLGGLIGLAGCTLVHAGIAMYVVRLASPLVGDARWIPYWKFFGFNNNQSGIFLFCLFLCCAVRLLAGSPRPWLGAAGMALAQGLAGFMYPLAWLGMGAASAVIVLGSLALRRSAAIAPLARYVGASVIGTGAILPYLLSINAGKTNPDAALHAVLSPLYLWQHAVSLAAALLVPLALGLAFRARVASLYRQSPWLAVPALAAAGCSGLYLIVSVPFACEYKFLAMLMLALGPVAALGTSWLVESRPLVGAALLTLMLHPIALNLPHHLRPWKVFEPVVERGTNLRAVDPGVDAVYSWLRDNTPADAVVIDTGLHAPTLARRSLFIAIPSPELPGVVTRVVHTQDGWLNTADQMLFWLSGYEPAFVERRRGFARALLAPTTTQAVGDAVAGVRAEIGARDTFVLIRDPAASSTLAAAGVPVAQQTGDVFIHRLPPPSPAP
jgi:hypothetical protein